MLARIVVDHSTFEKHPAVFRDIQRLSKQIHQETDKVLIEPKTGFLVSILVLLNRTDIVYNIDYDTSTLPITDKQTEKSR